MCLLGISMFVDLIDSQVEKVERPRWKKRLLSSSFAIYANLI